MADIEFSRTAAAGLSVGNRLMNILLQVRASAANRRAARATRNELLKLSDHELADIGLVRGNIDEISGWNLR